jgi:hypothetical protein
MQIYKAIILLKTSHSWKIIFFPCSNAESVITHHLQDSTELYTALNCTGGTIQSLLPAPFHAQTMLHCCTGNTHKTKDGGLTLQAFCTTGGVNICSNEVSCFVPDYKMTIHFS